MSVLLGCVFGGLAGLFAAAGIFKLRKYVEKNKKLAQEAENIRIQSEKKARQQELSASRKAKRKEEQARARDRRRENK